MAVRDGSRVERLSRGILPFVLGFVGALLAGCAVLKYRAFLSDWPFDLAFFHNLIASAARGDGFAQSASVHEQDGLRNLSHAAYVLPLWVPLYAVAPRIETLLVGQAVALVAGAFAVRRIARSAGAAEVLALHAAGAYLLAFPMWRLGLADFRELTLAVPALLWMLAAMLDRRPWEVAAAALLACLCREEVPLLVIAAGAAMGLFGRTNRTSALSAVNVGLGWFLLLWWIHPRLGFYIPFRDPMLVLAQLGASTPADVPLDRPLGHLARYLPLALWPALLEPALLLGAAPLLVYQLAASPYEWWQWTGAYVHHCGPLLAFTAAAGAAGWGRIWRWTAGWGRWRWAPLGVLLLALGLEAVATARSVHAALGLADGDAVVDARLERNRALRALLAEIPAEARVATDYQLIAHLSGRRSVYCYQVNFDVGGTDGSSGRVLPMLGDVDWMLIEGGHMDWIGRLDAEVGWEVAGSAGGYRLYRRSAPGQSP